MQNRFTTLLIIFLIILTSCSGQEYKTTIISPRVTLIPNPTLTHEPSLTATATQESADSLPVVPKSPTASLPPSDPAHVCSPLADHSLEQLSEIVSQPYDPPPAGKDDRHHGVDFAYFNHAGRAAIDGEGIQAIMAGRVAAAITDRLPYGNMVIIETPYEYLPEEILADFGIPEGNSVYHLYAHSSDPPKVEINHQIECGQLIGNVGKTGYVVPVAHLHLETRIGPPGVSFESMAFFDTQATPEEQAAYSRWRTSGDFQHRDPMIMLSGLIGPSP